MNNRVSLQRIFISQKLKANPQVNQISILHLSREMPKTPQTPSSQRTLHTFFKTEPVKRKSGADENKPTDTPVKKSKTDGESPEKKTPTTPGGSGLTEEQRRLMREKQALARLKLLSHSHALIDPTSIGASWFTDILETEFKKPYFKNLDNFYASAVRRATVYPQRQNIFSWTRYCELRDVKVVIIGQDPYHGPNQAHGLCFSVMKGVATPPSLLNMYKELVDDPGVPNFAAVPRHGCLEGWAKQGVLLLNAVLTVEASKANAHKDQGWESLTTAVIKWISSNLRNVVFLLWGAHAQKIGALVDKSRHSVLQTVHPSPLSAHRGFFGCRHFSKCNELLEKRGKEPVRWEELP